MHACVSELARWIVSHYGLLLEVIIMRIDVELRSRTNTLSRREREKDGETAYVHGFECVNE